MSERGCGTSINQHKYRVGAIYFPVCPAGSADWIARQLKKV
jgi:hypothetical protein